MASTFIQLPINESVISGPVAVTIDKLKIWDGVDILAINPDGSISISDSSLQNRKSYYNEITSVPSSTLTVILTVAPTQNGLIHTVNFAGTNIAMWTILRNGATLAKYYTSQQGGLSGDMELNSPFTSGDTLEVKVIHTRPPSGDFNATMSLIML